MAQDYDMSQEAVSGTTSRVHCFFGLWDSQGQCWECNWILYCIMLDMEVLSNVRQLMILLSVQVWI